MRALTALIASMMFGFAAYAAKPEDRAMGFQDAVTPVMERIVWFHDYVMIFLTAIVVLVLCLLVYVVYRFNRKDNPEPARFTHNTAVEVVWTGVPVLILLAIAVPSFQLLYMQDQVPEADMTVKTTGYQWYWGYEYPDHGDFGFESYMLERQEVAERGLPSDEYRLAVDTPMVVPINATVRLQVTAADVIHAWAMPAFGVKMDGYPGRLNETWFRAEKLGTYYGQCSEICGRLHAFMPIQVEVVTEPVFASWTAAMGEGDVDGANAIIQRFKDSQAAVNVASTDLD